MQPLPTRLKLAQLPTPIIPLTRLSQQVGHSLWLWRDDLTDAVASGNKLRKLEFLAAEAQAQGATRLITAGGEQSNHARATAAVARRLGLAVTLILRTPRQASAPGAPPSGNLLLDRVLGADLRILPIAEYHAAGSVYAPFLERERSASVARGERPYVIPEGGSCPLGCLGYVAGVEEMLGVWRATGPGTAAPDHLFSALGSGGTLAGLHLGYERAGLAPERVHGVNVCDSEAYFQTRVGKLLDETAAAYRLPLTQRRLSIFDGHVGAGYALASDEDLRFYAELARLEGVVLDPVYTGKAFQGMLRELKKTPGRFGGHTLFLHSGGLFATFAFAAQYATALG